MTERKKRRWKPTKRTGQPEYAIWSNIKQRCTNPNNHAYAQYGGRGITLCAEWHSFDGFLRDMGKRPAADLSVDRIDNDKGYEPRNCRWATRVEQSRNRRVVATVQYEGESLTLVDLAAKTGVAYSNLYRWYLAGELAARLGKPMWTVLHPSERIVRARTTKTKQSDHFAKPYNFGRDEAPQSPAANERKTERA